MRLPDIYNVPVVQMPHPIEVSVPGSKSITNRALLIAALGNGKSTLKGVLFSDDSRHFLKALIDLGFSVEIDEHKREVTIAGCGGVIPKKEAEIDVGSAGTAARFLTALLGLSKGRYRITASEQMKKRPMKELLCALQELGAKIAYEEEEYHFPLVIGNPSWKCHSAVVDVDRSSQFLSALLISAVLSKEDFSVHVEGSHGMAYVELTVAMMEQFGVAVLKRTDRDFVVSGRACYLSKEYRIEPDLSAACYFYAMCPLLRVPVKVSGVKWNGLQGDIAFLDVLKSMGCGERPKEDGIVLLPPVDGLRGGSFGESAFSDPALTLAAIAPFAGRAVVMEGVGHIRYQECDRIHAILFNLKQLGIRCSESGGCITIVPGRLHGGMVETYEDHRVAMAFALPGLVTEGVRIKNPQCCGKTFEDYFEVLEEKVAGDGAING